MDVLAEARRLVALWRPRLGIAEVVNVEALNDDQLSEREREAQCIPVERDGEGAWSFVLSISENVEPDRLERVVVHELMHVVLDPMRQWFETYIDRMADAHLRAYTSHFEVSAEGAVLHGWGARVT